jgi:hypothetical protein
MELRPQADDLKDMGLDVTALVTLRFCIPVRRVTICVCQTTDGCMRAMPFEGGSDQATGPVQQFVLSGPRVQALVLNHSDGVLSMRKFNDRDASLTRSDHPRVPAA